MLGLWSFIAGHYKDNRWVAAYDLLNEPVNVPDVKVFNDFFDRTIEAIRSVDNMHIIFLEGDHWAQDFSKFHQPQDPQIAYSFHFYPSFSLNPKAPESWSKNDLEKDLKPLLKIREHFHRPLWCGETGAGFSKESILLKRKLLRDTLDILEANEISWTLWAYKDAQAMGLVYPRQDTPWMQFVTAMNWQHTTEEKFAYQVFNFFEESKHFQTIPDSTRDRLQFRMRGIFHYLYLEQILKPKLTETPWAVMKELPASFLWDNCDYYPEIADLVRSYTLSRDR